MIKINQISKSIIFIIIVINFILIVNTDDINIINKKNDIK